MILPDLLLTLDEYSSWRVGRVVPMIRSAVQTTLRSFLRSDLVAGPLTSFLVFESLSFCSCLFVPRLTQARRLWKINGMDPVP